MYMKKAMVARIDVIKLSINKIITKMQNDPGREVVVISIVRVVHIDAKREKLI